MSMYVELKGRKNVVFVDSLAAASDVVQKFIEINELGASQFTGGRVFENGKKVAWVSYNGRVWTPEPWPKCREINVRTLGE